MTDHPSSSSSPGIPEHHHPAHLSQHGREHHKRRWSDVLIEWAKSNAVFKAVQRIALKLPNRFRKPFLVAVAVVSLVLASVVAISPFESGLMHAFDQWYSGNIQIGVVDTLAGDLGKKSLLYEFVFQRDKLANAVSSDNDIQAILRRPPSVVLKQPECIAYLGKQPIGIYPLVIVAQNSGDKTAKGYEVMISFSSADVRKPDPGVRIIGSSMDALNVQYVYQQISSESISALLQSCNSTTIATYRRDRMEQEGQKAQQQGGAEGTEPSAVPQLTRDTYRKLGLTRDAIFIGGTLEAHIFQAATILIAVPIDVKEFATIFSVECEDCAYFYKTLSYGQGVRVEQRPQLVGGH